MYVRTAHERYASLPWLIITMTVVALHLLQRIRYESHRFAIIYYRKLRGKALVALKRNAGRSEARHHNSVEMRRRQDDTKMAVFFITNAYSTVCTFVQ